jgi:uncharacterized membrane protein YqjE
LSAEPQEPQVARAIQDISTRVSLLVSDEIALAKAEIGAKAVSFGKGAALAGAALMFVLLALLLFAEAIAWALYSVTGHHIWLGFLLGAIVYIVLAGIAAFVAFKIISKVSSPMPTMAIAEAQATKQAVDEARRTA